MRCVLLSVLTAALHSFAYPIAQQRCEAWQTWPGRVLSFDPYLAQLRFTFPRQEISTSSNDESLVFNAYLSRCYDTSDAQCHTLILNDHEIASTADGSAGKFTILADDGSNVRRTIDLTATSDLVSVVNAAGEDLTYLSSRIQLIAVDGVSTSESFTVAFDTSRPQSRATLTASEGQKVDLAMPQSYCTIMADQTSLLDGVAEAEYLAQEIEAIKLLEQDVSRLQREIASRKDAASVRLAQYHAHVPLEELMQRCDGFVCSAKAIANRLYEKLTLALDHGGSYQRVQNPISASIGDERNITSNATELPSLEHTSTNLLLQVFTYIAGLLGLVTLFTILKRKCMSIRRRTERAADLEERRNARAYRCAARRANLQRRWTAFRGFFVCPKHKTIAHSTNYDEKRAMILQDALLEQHPEQMEKGDLMEAEIRQLRHARSILDGIVRNDGAKPDDAMLVKDPPPNLVPLPYSSSRSRSSTNTLPSYDSDSLPDYSSLPDDVELGIHVSDGFAQYSPPASDAGDFDYEGRMPVIGLVQGPTSISSIAALSPRASNETLRTRATLLSRADDRESMH